MAPGSAAIRSWPIAQQLELLAVPVWRGKPLYQSYLIADASREVDSHRRACGRRSRLLRSGFQLGLSGDRAELARRGRDARNASSVRSSSPTAIATSCARWRRVLPQSGSVDGYVYDVLREVEPALTQATRIVRASDWFGFPPIACPAAAVGSESTERLRRALLAMHEDDRRAATCFEALRLDSFAAEPPSLFDPIAANMELVRGLG